MIFHPRAEPMIASNFQPISLFLARYPFGSLLYFKKRPNALNSLAKEAHHITQDSCNPIILVDIGLNHIILAIGLHMGIFGKPTCPYLEKLEPLVLISCTGMSKS